MIVPIVGVAQCLPFEPGEKDPAAAAAAVTDGRPVAEWFDAKTALPGRGVRYLPLVSQLLTAAGRPLLGQIHEIPTDVRTLWVGSASCGARVHAELDESIRNGNINLMSPALAPFFAVNLTGSRLSTELTAHGGVTTITTPSTCVLDCLTAAGTALQAGRTALALIGAVEDSPLGDDPPVDGTDSGAIAMIATRSGQSIAECDVRRGFWTTATLAQDAGTLLLGLSGIPVIVCLDRAMPADDAASFLDALRRTTGSDVAVVNASAGGLAAAVAIASAIARREPRVVVAVSALGHLAAAHVRPTRS